MGHCGNECAGTIWNNMAEPLHSTDPDGCPDSRQRNTATLTLSERLYRDVTGMIADGTFAVGERLPSVRTMAQRRGVSRDTVLRAYDRLVAGVAHMRSAVRGISLLSRTI